jgi:adenine-specific DNA-methyltransferase
MDKLDMQTNDLAEKNVEKIFELFPTVVKEGLIDFDLLKQELLNVLVEGAEERYRLDWPGKRASILKANIPVNKTLRPVKEESVDFENTENLYIEGDNFDALKILQESYLSKVKMIYIDPPYNTGKDFVYCDNFKQSKKEFDEEIGAVDEEGNKLFKNTETNGRFHSDWLSMMYERLIVSRDFLKDDGVIFISIDDNEVDNLKKICCEIFGESNFIGQMIRQRIEGGKQDSKTIQTIHEYVLVFCKNILNVSINKKLQTNFDHYDKIDEHFERRGKYYLKPLFNSGLNYSQSLTYDIEAPDKTVISLPRDNKTIWLWSEKTFLGCKKDGFIEFIKNKNNEYKVYYKTYQFVDKFDNLIERSTPYNSMFLDGYTNRQSAKDIKKLFNVSKFFDYTKPLSLMKELISMGTNENDIVLDFFSGSASCAQGIFELNKMDGKMRKFIMIQLPEKTDEKSEAYKQGYKTISDVGKERIRRAANKIKEDNKDKDLSNIDFGFRVYKTDLSNMKDIYYNPKELGQGDINKLISNIKEDRTPEDVLTQVILDLGLELSLRIELKEILGNKVFFVAENSLVACFDKNINFKIIDEIASIKPLKVVFVDASFKDDKDRINVEERFKRLSAETVIKVI